MTLENIKGIGPKTIYYLKALGINNYDDLVNYYPYRFNVLKRGNLTNTGEVITVCGTIISEVKLSYIKRNLNRLNFSVMINNQVVKVTIFNRAFLKPNLTLNKGITLTGKYNSLNGTFVANDILLYEIKDMLINPIYHTVKGIKNSSLNKIIVNAITLDKVTSTLPEELETRYNFISKLEALKIIHSPSNIDDLKKAKLRLIYEELFNFMTKINYLAEKKKSDNYLNRTVDKIEVLNFIDTLPFMLTADQLNAVTDIYEDLVSKKRMNRLLLGDVGSGKTIVSFIAMYINYLGGYQSALMVPTEILASQHYQNILNVLPPNIKVELITGKLAKKDKLKIYENLTNGTTDIVIGTHSLLNEELSFKNLGLVITDEQHRFGVNQRKSLYNKGIKPDVLYMSATPIPRTYALTIYGDMDTSMIKTKPGNRVEVKTKVLSEENINEVLLKVKSELALNHQVYVVAPAITSDEDEDLNDVNILKEKYSKAFKDKKIGLLHGKLKENEKNQIISDFSAKKIDILISTTVIEVGIDVPNATIMIIYNGERFGLSTLHQLRGRVGRSDLESFCYIISEKSRDKLKILEETSDGFLIAESDFNLRGEGDLFGVLQSGDMHFKIADLKRDYKILLQAKKDSQDLLAKNRESLDNILGNLEIID